MIKYFYYSKVKSTQDLAKEYIINNEGAACFIADEQTAGYGKRNRSFYSPRDSGIYFSLVLPNFNLKGKQANLLTPAIAVHILLVLKNFSPKANIQIKWVNDLYLQEKKIGGILTEQIANGLVIGVGINLNTKIFPNELRGKAGSILSQNIKLAIKQKLLATLIRATMSATNISKTENTLKLYRQFSNLIGRQVIVQVGRNTYAGKVLEIDDQARLVVECDNHIQAFASGEVIRTTMINTLYT